MGAKSSKCTSDQFEKAKRSLPPVHHNAIEEDEYVTFMCELARRSDRQYDWRIYCTEIDKDVATQIPYRSTLALRFDAYKAVLHDARAPIDILPMLASKPLSFYQTTVQMKDSSILINGIVYQDVELPYKLTLERIRDDPVYAYQGSLIVGYKKPVVVYLKHTTQSIFRQSSN
jgi:hypothetical protein